MDYFQDDLDWDPKAKTQLKVIIVGAGIAGLTLAIGLKQSGHEVIVLEQVQEIAEVGAGIQIAPNLSRCLARLGLLEEVLKYANLLEKNSLRRWQNNEELGSAPLMPQISQKYHAPLGVIHRGDFQRILLEAAKFNGVDIRTAAHVSSVDSDFEPRIQLKSGEWLSGDIVIAADGIKSGIRRQIAEAHNLVDKSMSTGDAAYRILIPKEHMKHDEEAMKLLSQNVGMRWMGPKGHIMAYPIKNNTVYNMVLLHPQQPGSENDESWNRKGDKREMMEFYKDWNGVVKNLLSYVPEGEVMEWTLNSHQPLPSWHENKVILIGDACHPMLPYVAQGAAQAIEDAATLTAAFSQITSISELDIAIEIYEYERKARAEAIQNSAAQTRMSLHLPDGPKQEARDRKIREAANGKGQNPDLWADAEWQEFMWGRDVMGDVVRNWEDLKCKAQEHLLQNPSSLVY